MDNTSSSESELEQNFKLDVKQNPNQKINFKKCVLCQSSAATCLVRSTNKSKQKILESAKIRASLQNQTLSTINLNINEIGQENVILWHKNCYKSFTSKSSINALRLAFYYVFIPMLQGLRLDHQTSRVINICKNLNDVRFYKGLHSGFHNISRKNLLY